MIRWLRVQKRYAAACRSLNTIEGLLGYIMDWIAALAMNICSCIMKLSTQPDSAGLMAQATSSLGISSTNILDKIDKLSACNVGHLIDLPQLVVVGDQSSGKSSVLEGVTGLPFPRDVDVCTRFATQISFRRSSETSVSVFIKPSTDASETHANTLRAWSKTELAPLNRSSFSAIIHEVSMGNL
jgi:hypothetical protein